MCDMNMYDQKIKKKQLLSINGFCYNKKALHRNRFNFFDPPHQKLKHVQPICFINATKKWHL